MVRLAWPASAWIVFVVAPRMPAPDYHIELITLPVSDVDLAVRFYAERAGFILDVDYRPNRAIPRCPAHPTRVILFGAVRRRPH